LCRRIFRRRGPVLCRRVRTYGEDISVCMMRAAGGGDGGAAAAATTTTTTTTAGVQATGSVCCSPVAAAANDRAIWGVRGLAGEPEAAGCIWKLISKKYRQRCLASLFLEVRLSLPASDAPAGVPRYTVGPPGPALLRFLHFLHANSLWSPLNLPCPVAYASPALSTDSRFWVSPPFFGCAPDRSIFDAFFLALLLLLRRANHADRVARPVSGQSRPQAFSRAYRAQHRRSARSSRQPGSMTAGPTPVCAASPLYLSIMMVRQETSPLWQHR